MDLGDSEVWRNFSLYILQSDQYHKMHDKGFERAEPWQVLVLVPSMFLLPRVVLLLWPVRTWLFLQQLQAQSLAQSLHGNCWAVSRGQMHNIISQCTTVNQPSRHTTGTCPRFCSGSADAPNANSTFYNICWNQCPLPNQAFRKCTHWDNCLFILQEYGSSQRLEASKPPFPLSYPTLEGP